LARANPRYVKVVFVAARKAEMSGIKKNLDNYGESGGELRPYLPNPRDEIDLLVFDVMNRERLISDGSIAIDERLIERISEAEAANRIVIILIEPWTLLLESYRKIMHELDSYNFFNCVMIVLWNEQDPETISNRAHLEANIESIFPKRLILNDPQ